MSLYDRVGGEPTVEVIVDALFERILADPQFSAWFEASDLERLKGHQRAFLAVALGGPEQYAGRSMRSAHGGLAITNEMFAAFVDHLAHATVSAGAGEEVALEITKRVAPMRAAVVRVH